MFHYGNHVENDLFWAGFGENWESTSLRLWTKLCSDAGTILDIGANTGVYALSARLVNDSADIYAFEPVERVYEKLKRNISLNGYRIEAVKAGVSDKTGSAKIFDFESDHVYSASLEASYAHGRGSIIEGQIPTVRVDNFLSKKPADGPMVVKIDVEGHEFKVLDGFGSLLRKHRPDMLIEILDKDAGSRIEQLSSGMGYLFFEILEGRGIRAAQCLGRAERNYLLCRQRSASRFGLDSLGLNDEMPHAALVDR